MKHWQKYRMKFILLVMFIFPLTVSAKSYGEIKELSLLSEGISSMEIECGAGFLKLKGVEGLDEIKVKADIIAGNKKGKSLAEFIEEYIDLSLERHGDRAVLISRIKPSHFSFSFWGDGNSRIDLTVEVPGKMNIEINDGSGDLTITNIDGKTNIHDGSGELNIHSVKGRIDIRDGSGSMDIRDITGNMTVSDGSGEIKIDKVIGDLEIRDGSGSIRTTDIEGNVKIYDGSGSIYIDGVSKDVDIPESGSGGVQFKNVKGNVSGDL